MITLVCIVSSTAMHTLHFRKTDVNDLYPAIKFAAGLSADTATSVPRSFTVCLSITNDTPSSFILKKDAINDNANIMQHAGADLAISERGSCKDGK